MAARLLGAGFEVAVHDAAAEALDALPGAVICRDPRDVSDRAEIVLISLPSPAAVRDVAAGPRGLIGGSSMRVYVDLSTTGPEVAAEVGAWMDVAGVECVDAPVSGGPGGAQSGQLTIMLSGSAAALESARPVLEHLGSKFFNVGERAGHAQTAKVVNNLLLASALAATSEALALGVRAGLDPEVLLDVINASSGASHASANKVPQQVLSGDFDHGFGMSLMAKDVRLCLDEAQRQQVPMLLGATVSQLWTLAERLRPEGADCTEIARVIEEWSGVTIRRAP